MTRTELEVLQSRWSASGQPLKAFLKGEGIAYSTYNYWRRKLEPQPEPLPLAPISITAPSVAADAPDAVAATTVPPGVTLAFPNGVRAHFGSGSDGVLMEVLTKSMGHVLP